MGQASSFLLTCAAPSAVWSWPGFDPSWFDIDLMHCGDLGVLLVTFGNILWEVVVHLGGTWKDMKTQQLRIYQ